MWPGGERDGGMDGRGGGESRMEGALCSADFSLTAPPDATAPVGTTRWPWCPAENC